MRTGRWPHCSFLFRSHNSSAVKTDSRGRRLSFEPLEDRRVLAAVESTVTAASPGEQVIDIGISSSVARNRGDFYYSGSTQIPLLRRPISLILMA